MSTGFRVRPAAPGDVRDIHELDLAIARDGRGIVVSFDQLTARGPSAAAFIAETLDPKTREAGVMLVAEVDGTVVAEANVRRLKMDLARHVGVFGLGVHPRVQRRGIGRALLRASVDWARAHGIERLELYVRRDNTRALPLYESEGFELESTRVRFVRLADGSYVDDLGYVLFL